MKKYVIFLFIIISFLFIVKIQVKACETYNGDPSKPNCGGSTGKACCTGTCPVDANGRSTCSGPDPNAGACLAGICSGWSPGDPGTQGFSCSRWGNAGDCKGDSHCTWTPTCCKIYCSKSCGGGTCSEFNGTNWYNSSCNNQSCTPPTATPVPPTAVPPTDTPIPPTATPVPPAATATPVPPAATATPVPGCVCETGDVCSSNCPVNTEANRFTTAPIPIPTYSVPMKCAQQDTNLYPTPPASTDKNSFCNRQYRPKGDVDGDGHVTTQDYFYYVSAVSGGALPANVNTDVNGDGVTDARDRAIIFRGRAAGI